MKIAAAILAILTLFMTAQEPVLSSNVPVPEEDCSVEGSCFTSTKTCGKETPEIPGEETPGKCCDYDFCNPFGACCCYVIVDRPLLSADCFLLRRKKVALVNENATSSYAQDVWNPPKTTLSF